MAFSISSSWQEKKVSSQTTTAINYPANLAWRNLHIASQILRIPCSPSATVCCLRSQRQPVQDMNGIHGQCKSKSGKPRRYFQAFQQSRSDKFYSREMRSHVQMFIRRTSHWPGEEILVLAAIGDHLYSMRNRTHCLSMQHTSVCFVQSARVRSCKSWCKLDCVAQASGTRCLRCLL